MGKRGFLFILLFIVVVFLMGTQDVMGQEGARMCWQMVPYVDVFDLSITQQSNDSYLLVGKDTTWLYLMPCVGSASQVPQDGRINMGLHCTNYTAAFNGQSDCVISGLIDPESLVGPAKIECGAGLFTRTGTLVPIGCDTEPTQSGEVAGE